MQRNKLTLEFLKIRAQLGEGELLHATINWHTAPVCYSHKPSTLINLGNPQSRQLARLWIQYCKDDLNGKNIYKKHSCNYYDFNISIHYEDMTLTPFIGINGSLHLFCYNFNRLEIICRNEKVRSFLREAGYFAFEPEYCIAKLKKRFRQNCPHEIGVFLGYPLEDVKAFIQNRGRNYKLNGYWKVYSNVPKAVEIFQGFNQAKSQVLTKWKHLTIPQVSEKIENGKLMSTFSLRPIGRKNCNP